MKANGTSVKAAIAALAKLPVARIARLVIEPGDVIVIEVTRELSEEERVTGSRQLQRAFPHNRVLILGTGMTLKIGTERP